MKSRVNQLFTALIGLLIATNVQAATDSYRFLHVTIETPWAIFLFLLIFILTPFVLMAMLYWYFAFKKTKEESASDSEQTQPTARKSSE